MPTKYDEVIKEIMDEIETALQDSNGIISHQRRLIFLLSLGSINLVEYKLKKLNILKPGYNINHRWFGKKKDNVKKLISNIITFNINEIPNFDEMLDLVYDIEKERNELAYGKTASEEKLRKKIKSFLDLKKKVEND